MFYERKRGNPFPHLAQATCLMRKGKQIYMKSSAFELLSYYFPFIIAKDISKQLTGKVCIVL